MQAARDTPDYLIYYMPVDTGNQLRVNWPTFNKNTKIMSGASGGGGGAGMWQGIAQAASSVMGLLDGAFNRRATKRNNEDQRIWSKHMWQLENAYNHPKEQMERLRQAGLNPNLVYGNGSAANTAGSASVPSTDPLPSLNIAESLGGAMSGYIDTQMKNAQINNLGKQSSVMDADIAQKLSSAAFTKAQTARSAFDLKFSQDMRDTSADAMYESVRQQKLKNLEYEITNANLPRQLQQNYLESLSRIRSAQFQNQLQKAQTDMVRDDLRYREKNMQPNDPLWARQLDRLYNSSHHKRVMKNLGKAKDWMSGEAINYIAKRAVIGN